LDRLPVDFCLRDFDVSKRTLVIWNGNAGSTDKAAELRRQLQECPTVDFCEPADRNEAMRRVDRAARQDVRLIVAAGGDGTVSSVVNGLCRNGHKTTLGILPLGTGNDLCRTLGIPLDPTEAGKLLWPAITAGELGTSLRSIDVVESHSAGEPVFFANAVSGGNAAEVTKHVTAEMKQRWGPWCYVQGAVAVISGMSDFDTEIRMDDNPPEQFHTWAIIVANGRTAGGGVEVAPKADLEDGLLDIVLILEANPVEAAIMTTNYLMGSFLEDSRIVFRQASEVSIRCEPDAKFVADGEHLTAGPVKFSVRPRALRVIAPV